MGKLEFHANTAPTLGVEIELGLVDAETMQLTSAIEPLAQGLPEADQDWCKPELMQCCVEVITGVCQTVDDAGADLRAKLGRIEQVGDRLGVRLWWGSTHPFSPWQAQRVTENERYLNLVNLLQELARRLVTFGLHVHVGVDSGDKAVMLCDRIMQHLPFLLAVTASSPFWENRDTGLQSRRSKIMEGLPTAGLPPLMRNWSEYVWLVNHMVDTGFINTIREIWWDVRPHHKFGTVEIRVCDMPGSLDDVLAVAAFCQSLVKALSDEIDNGAYQHDCHPMLVRQNKWRACRFGNRAQLVNGYTYEVRSAPKTAEFLVRRLESTAVGLRCLPHLERIIAMAEGPGWAERQRAILRDTQQPREIVAQLTQASRVSPHTGEHSRRLREEFGFNNE